MRKHALFAIVVLLAVSKFSYSDTLLQFKNLLEVSPFADGNNWFLTGDLYYEIGDTGAEVKVPKGFVTDFASIPRLFWTVLPKWGKHGAPAVVHDFLYWDQRCTRRQADAIMKIAMEESGVGPIRRWAIRSAVRMGGSFSWRKNRKARQKGKVRRIPNKLFPRDPTVTWSKYHDVLIEKGINPEPRPDGTPTPSYCTALEEISKKP